MALIPVNLEDTNNQYLKQFTENISSILTEFDVNEDSLSFTRPKGTSGCKVYELFNENGETSNYAKLPILKGITESMPSGVFLSKIGISNIDATIAEEAPHTENYDTTNGWHRYHIPLKVKNDIISFDIGSLNYTWDVGTVYDFTTPSVIHGVKSLGGGTTLDNRVIIILDVFDNGEPLQAIKDSLKSVSDTIRVALLNTPEGGY